MPQTRAARSTKRRKLIMLTVTLIGASRDAWGYLLNTVADQHTIDRAEGKAAYYMANGTPPGAWIGTGAIGLGLEAGGQVAEGELQALFGDGTHPVTGSPLGRKFTTVAPAGKTNPATHPGGRGRPRKPWPWPRRIRGARGPDPSERERREDHTICSRIRVRCSPRPRAYLPGGRSPTPN